MRTRAYKVTKSMLKGYDEEYVEKYVGDYLIKEWDFGEKQDVIEISSENIFDDESGTMKMIMKPTVYQIYQIVTCLRKAPHNVDVEYVKRMPNKIAKVISELVREVNEEEDENSPELKK